MTDLERRALLGDRQAQDECTRQGIALPCPGASDICHSDMDDEFCSGFDPKEEPQ